jgi:hypothetical protein
LFICGRGSDVLFHVDGVKVEGYFHQWCRTIIVWLSFCLAHITSGLATWWQITSPAVGILVLKCLVGVVYLFVNYLAPSRLKVDYCNFWYGHSRLNLHHQLYHLLYLVSFSLLLWCIFSLLLCMIIDHH